MLGGALQQEKFCNVVKSYIAASYGNLFWNIEYLMHKCYLHWDDTKGNIFISETSWMKVYFNSDIKQLLILKIQIHLIEYKEIEYDMRIY